MAPTRKPSWSEKGNSEFELTLPATITESGKPEKALFRYTWEVRTTKPMTARGWTRWEIQCARVHLARAAYALKRGELVEERDLSSAITHAVWAWCRTHLRGKGSNDAACYSAFFAKAPDALTRLESHSHAALRGLANGTVGSADALIAARTFVEALLDAAEHSPRNRRRFPARYKADRPVHKPRVKPGGWINTGRYRPAQVLSIAQDPPHTMVISYGDETDDDFRPHVTDWKTIRQRKRPPSLKDVFLPGDWIRQAWFGYGRVLMVRDSTMDVAFAKGEETLIPDAHLFGIEKVDGPEPEDNRPVAERFPPGTWIDRGLSGPYVVIAADENTQTVLHSEGVTTFFITGDGPAIWKRDEPPLDLTLPREKRRIWWWKNDTLRHGCRPCPCCGYPNLGNGFDIEPRQCLQCSWTDEGDEWDEEIDIDEVRSASEFDDEEWPNWGYSLTQARDNFERQGLMFRRDDPHADAFKSVASLRGELKQKLDDIMLCGSDQGGEKWQAVEQIAREIDRCRRERSVL